MEIFVPLQIAPAAPVRQPLAPGATEDSGLHEPDPVASSATRARAFDALLAEELTQRSAPAEPANEGELAATPAIGAHELVSAPLVLPPPAVYAQSAVSALAQNAHHAANGEIAAEEVPAPPPSAPATDHASPHPRAVATVREPLSTAGNAHAAEQAGRDEVRSLRAPQDVTTTPGPTAASAVMAALDRTGAKHFTGAGKNEMHVRDGEAAPAQGSRLAQPGDPIRIAVEPPSFPSGLSAQETLKLALTSPDWRRAAGSPERGSAAAVPLAPAGEGPEAAPTRRDLTAADPGVVSSGLQHEPAAEPWLHPAASRTSMASVTAPVPTTVAGASEGPFSPSVPGASTPPLTLLAPERSAESHASPGREPSTTQPIFHSGAALTPAVQAPHANAPAASETPLAARIETPFASQSWGNAFAGRIAWLAGQGEQGARLHLNPPELGPVTVTLHVSAEEASARFVAAHIAVREAIEAALPRLREMLAENGISLGETEVSGETSGQHTAREQSHRFGEAGARLQSASADASDERAVRAGLVDTYA
jgi:flagellar hook-length control protein FliK